MKILIADDHPMLRDALARTLGQLLPEATIVEAGDYAQAEQAARAHAALGAPLDLALVDLHMPGMGGAEGVRRLVACGLRVAVVSGDDAPAVMRAAFAAGAVAFLPKSDAQDAMRQALRVVCEGGHWLPPQVLAEVPPAALPRPALPALTPRQADVLRCLMRGEPNKRIARELGLTEGTVKIHIAAILRVLQARNRTEAVVIARELGWAG
jgi:DNA-binding NarL/FixJ family response regulator